MNLHYKDVSETPLYRRQWNSIIKTLIKLHYKDIRELRYTNDSETPLEFMFSSILHIGGQKNYLKGFQTSMQGGAFPVSSWCNE